MKKSKVSVIIPTYNAEHFIKRCIDKVLDQTYEDLEIIVIDDCSSDKTVSLLKSYSNNVTILQNDINKGPAYSRTRGLFACSGEYVAFLDADDYWDKAFVQSTVSFLESNPDAVAVSTAYRGIDLKGKEIYKPQLNSIDRDYYAKEGSICPDFFEFWSRYFGILTGTVMMRTEIAKKTKGQREELRLTEDLEFWGYLSTFGKWGFIPRPLFTTDPGVLSPWERLRKMEKRYRFFSDLEIDVWTNRIRSRVSESQVASYRKIVNHIKTTIAISNAYTLKYNRAYILVGLWNRDLEAGLGGVLKKGYRFGKLIWPVFCLALRVREYFKSYFAYFLRNV